MRIILLGTNGWYDNETGHTPCVLIETADCYLVLDAGSGFAQLDKYLCGEKPVYLFLSHFHLDHTIGLHTLAKFNFANGLTIVGQAGTLEALNGLLRSPYTISLDKLRYATTIYEMPEGPPSLPFKVTSLPLVHADPCIGFRFELNGKVLTYCTDTGYCENAVELGREADLLLTECALRPGDVDNGWPHLNPQLAARIAEESGAKQLVLIHFDAKNYPNLDDRKIAESAARQIFPATVAGLDGMELEL
jgi:ribonuclease BN (tRNA processing enzyme)